ncbi:hypothetical protein [Microvirga sp. VF16]|uniref:hypothetical protein n=1 Tax=Microvirga sp. VF16 TaxID=2807101 RepID=UPI00193CD7A3|nr:hypothetical protein [Microvirga sp. VF16]QRM32517.1 hypothetical protein JO965_30995 [Microvirga sp. VF16]
MNLVRFQRSGDLAVLNFDSQEVRDQFGPLGQGRKSYFSVLDAISEGIVIANGKVTLRSRTGLDKICSVSELTMPGHHIANALAAAAVAVEYGASRQSIREGLIEFRGLPQRCEFLGRLDGVDIYDDSIGMNPRKALLGLESMSAESLTVVCGGAVQSASGEKRVSSELEQQDLHHFCTALAKMAKTVVLFGEGGDVIVRNLKDAGEAGPTIAHADRFSSAVQEALRCADGKGSLLISPVFFNAPWAVRPVLEQLFAPKQ